MVDSSQTCFSQLLFECWGLLKKHIRQDIAICFLYRYASMQPALLPQGAKTKANKIQAKYIVLWFGVCGDRACVLLLDR